MRLPPLPWFTAPAFVLTGLVVGGVVYVSGFHGSADIVWGITLIAGALPMFWEMLKALRRGHFGIDIIAIVAIASSIVLHQYMAGIVILLMLSGGEALEIFALRRARKDLTSLINNAPTQAHKQLEGSLIDVPVDAVVPGDTIIVKPGESVPVDGQVLKGRSMVDESKLTGEPIPVEKREGSNVMSGSICQDGVLTVRVLRPSHESKYEQILRLVRDAEEKKAPFVRLADRYSVWFTSVTFILAAVAWFLSNDPIRVLAVLVVATPCPLILATPIAFAAGISRAAKRGIIVKNGGALEKLGTARCFVFDKTGTLTLGIPAVLRIEQFNSSVQEVLHIAASLDQLSTHVLARALIRHARSQNVTLAYPDDFSERFGDGVMGTIDGKKYMLGRLSFLEEHGLRIDAAIAKEHEGARERGEIAVYLGSDTQILGAVFFSDIVRDNVRGLFDGLRHLGIQKIVMLTGDKKNVALKLGKAVGIPEADIYAEALPDGKVRTVTDLRKNFAPVVMVGDGVNDAPAIAVADVGIAMGSHGSTASSEAGDVVILLEKIERVGEAMCVGHAVLRIAKESIFIGIGLSLVLMVLASMGFIPPVVGALLQEIIDVIVILNALRTLFVKVGCGVTSGGLGVGN